MAKKSKSGGRKTALIVVCVLVALVLAAVIGVAAFVNSYLDRINRVSNAQEPLSDEEIEIILSETEEEDADFTGEALEPEDVTMPSEAEVIETKDHVYNILLIGQDRRETTGRARSDSMILCTIDTEKKTLVMTSFLRDTYVDLPDWNGKSYSYNRLNVNYAFGGMGMLNEALKLNFGVVVDHNVEVDFTGFQDVIDAMGGIDIELTSGEAWVVGGNAKAGMNHLNGEQALSYARIRKLDNDFGRTNRQRKVLTVLLEKIKTMSLTELNDLANTILPLITTDMSNSDIFGYIMKFFPILPELQLSTQYIPAEGTYQFASIHGMSVLVADMDANRQILKDTLGG